MLRILCFFIIPFLVLSGCKRDDEAELRARLSAWFHLGETVSFETQMRCTAAVFAVEGVETRPALPVQASLNSAKEAFSMDGLVAFQMADYSPNDLTDALLLSGRGTFGKQALAAAAQAVPCFRETPAEGSLREALTRPGAMIAYDRESEGLMILDPEALRLFYVGGDAL